MTAIVCQPPAFRLRDNRRNIDPRLDAVEELLQLRHDIDDHDLVITLLRGIRPDLDVLTIEGAITELLDLGSQVRRAETPGEYFDAVDRYFAQLHAFAYGGPR